uniref:DNA-directed RNA polymerase n=1 Tax=Gongylonema pulchrum TaxID=637853 RepID=A0A183D1B3_9BILA
LPINMAGRRYAFSLPESAAPDAHSVIYFIPVLQPTTLHIAAYTANRSDSYDLKIDPSEPVQAYFGSNEAITMYISAHIPFQVIVSMQQLLLNYFLFKRHVDFGCTMAAPVAERGRSARKLLKMFIT